MMSDGISRAVNGVLTASGRRERLGCREERRHGRKPHDISYNAWALGEQTA